MESIIEETGKIFAVTVSRYFAIAGIFFFIFYLLLSKKFNASKIQNRIAGRSDFLREVGHSLVTSVVFTIITIVVLFTPLKSYTLIYDDIAAYPVWWLPLSVALSLVIHDTYFYWMHRILHHKNLFKHAHLVHHKSTNPSPWASYSFHFLEAIAEGGVLFVLAFILPMHLLAILLFVVIGFVINVYGHLGYEIMPRWVRHTFLFEVINTSVHHNMHHSKFKGNYGLYFRVWDRLCKTEHPDYVKEYDRIQKSRFEKQIHETGAIGRSLRA
jgi:sterol desaturase/sphingolipid hydroxylase (fatty acid hydroxylase superfamily)